MPKNRKSSAHNYKMQAKNEVLINYRQEHIKAYNRNQKFTRHIAHNIVSGEDMWSFLIVTAERREWDDLLTREGNGFYAFSYTWNRSYDYGSEFGDIYIQSFGGGIRRLA